jgi:hypothetical protein
VKNPNSPSSSTATLGCVHFAKPTQAFEARSMRFTLRRVEGRAKRPVRHSGGAAHPELNYEAVPLAHFPDGEEVTPGGLSAS